MKELVVLFGLLVFIAALAGTIEHYRDVKRIRKLARKVRGIGLKDLLASVVWGGVILLSIIIGTSQIGFKVDDDLSVLIILMMSISAFYLLFLDYKLFQLIENNWKIISAIFGIFAFGLTLLASVYVDAEITSLTKLNASFFPSAQNYILLLIAPLFWAYFLVFLALAVYFLHAFVIFIRMFREVGYLERVYSSLCVVFGFKRSKRKLNFHQDTAILMGLLMFINIIPPLIINISSSSFFQSKIPELLVFSSYHSDESACKNIDGENIKIAFLKGKSVSIVEVTSKEDYIFSVEQCERPTNKK